MNRKAVFLLIGTLGTATSVWAAETKSAQPGDDLFAPPQVLELRIEIPEAGLDSLRQAPKEYVKVVVQEGDRLLSNVGLRYKGSTLLGSPGGRPSFTVKFNEFVSGQKFHGLSRMLLDACPKDPTCLTPLLANELYRLAGVPAPRCAFARLNVNGKDLGLYVLAESMNKDFLSQHFDRAKGNLYEGDGSDVTAPLDKDSGDTAKDQPDVDALAKAAQESNPAQRWATLEKLLDVDRFVSFLAIEVLAWQTNGYAMRANKYRLYHDPSTDRMVFLPHGTEPGFLTVDGPLMPPVVGVVANAVLQSPQGMKLYRERMARLLANQFKPDALQAQVTQLAALVRPVIAKSNPGAVAAFDTAVAQLRERFARRAYVLEQALRKN
jgi:hypothetical protein